MKVTFLKDPTPYAAVNEMLERVQTAVSWRGEPVENLEETIALIRYVGSVVRDQRLEIGD